MKGGTPKWFRRPRETGLRQKVLRDSPGDRRVGAVDPVTGERLYTDEEVAFLKAADVYRRRHGRRWLTACDYLRVCKELGYQQG